MIQVTRTGDFSGRDNFPFLKKLRTMIICENGVFDFLRTILISKLSTVFDNLRTMVINLRTDLIPRRVWCSY